MNLRRPSAWPFAQRRLLRVLRSHGFALGTIDAAVASAEMNNVIFILAVDLSWSEEGSYGQQEISTPNLDRLAAQGMRFTEHYRGAPRRRKRVVILSGAQAGQRAERSRRIFRLRAPHRRCPQRSVILRELRMTVLFDRPTDRPTDHSTTFPALRTATPIAPRFSKTLAPSFP